MSLAINNLVLQQLTRHHQSPLSVIIVLLANINTPPQKSKFNFMTKENIYINEIYFI